MNGAFCAMEPMSNRDAVFSLYHRGADPMEVLSELLSRHASTYPDRLPTEPVDLWETLLF
jgi:hypothetical protein